MRRVIILLLCLLLLCTFSMTAYAHEIPDESRKGTITVDIAKAKGDYKGRYQERTYLLDVRSESSPSNVTVAGKPLSAISPEAFNAGQEGWYFDASDRMGRVKVRTNRLSTNQDQKIVIGF